MLISAYQNSVQQNIDIAYNMGVSYDFIYIIVLCRYLLTSSGPDIKFSKHIIEEYVGPYTGLTWTMVDISNH